MAWRCVGRPGNSRTAMQPGALDVVSGWRMLSSAGAHYPGPSSTASLQVAARCVTKPTPESSCEMGIVAKAAGVRDFAEMLTCSARRPACQQARGVVQTNGIDQFAACAAARRQELLDVAQRNPRFCCHLCRTEVRIVATIVYDAADAGEQSIRMTRDGPRIRRRKQGAKEVVEGEPHVRARRCGCGFFASDTVENELTEGARCYGSAART